MVLKSDVSVILKHRYKTVGKDNLAMSLLLPKTSMQVIETTWNKVTLFK